MEPIKTVLSPSVSDSQNLQQQQQQQQQQLQTSPLKLPLQQSPTEDVKHFVEAEQPSTTQTTQQQQQHQQQQQQLRLMGDSKMEEASDLKENQQSSVASHEPGNWSRFKIGDLIHVRM